ncbi:hypothetical protein [Gordonia sp. (in: high G+C Gram-positive bacteria)]|uniref:hypothetical protein n=1 Tax=Gordonia sp. (in: high G+C Gram-positive bacteria) TaxID=84139 RepID=UPI003C74FF61
MKKLVFAAIAAGLLVGITGCGIDDDDAKDQLTGTQEYSSVDEIGSDLKERSIDCTPQRDSTSKVFTTSGRCTVDGTEIVFGIFTNDSQLSEYKSTINFVSTTIGEASYLVIGSNWVANCSADQDCADQIQGQLGGQVWTSQS